MRRPTPPAPPSGPRLRAVPPLVVNGPPSGRGWLPVGPDFPAEVVIVPACSFCRDAGWPGGCFGCGSVTTDVDAAGPPSWDDDGSNCPWCDTRCGGACADEITAHPPMFVRAPR